MRRVGYLKQIFQGHLENASDTQCVIEPRIAAGANDSSDLPVRDAGVLGEVQLRDLSLRERGP